MNLTHAEQQNKTCLFYDTHFLTNRDTTRSDYMQHEKSVAMKSISRLATQQSFWYPFCSAYIIDNAGYCQLECLCI